ncbi:MAG: hypothetical protein ACO1N7_11485 [Sphingobacteriaceae bacterium]
MKKLVFVLSLVGSIALISCGSGPREESDDQDSINAARAADSMIQNELNADTSMNSGNTIDNMSTDSMPKGGER